MYPNVHISAMTWKPRHESKLKGPLTVKCIKKMWYIHTVEYYLAIKKNEKPISATWVDLEIITLSEVNQTEKDKYPIAYCGL